MLSEKMLSYSMYYANLSLDYCGADILYKNYKRTFTSFSWPFKFAFLFASSYFPRVVLK